MPRLIQKGSTDISLYFLIVDSADGSPETGVTITDLDLQYVRFGAAPVAKVDATALAATDSIHAANKAFEVDGTDQPGLYRVDWPDAAFVTGVDGVVLTVKGTGFHPAHMEIQLVDFDPTDAVRLGLTALPNAAAEAAGGLFTRGAGAGQINQDNNGEIDVDVQKWLGTAAATPTVAGVPEVDLTHLMGAILTEGGAGRLAAAFIKLLDVVTPVLVASDVMRGTDGANTTVPDAAGTAAGLHGTTDGKVDAIQTDLGDFSGRTNDQTLLDVLGVPDVAGKDLHTLLVTDRLDEGTFGLSALQTLLAAIPTTAMRGTDNAALASVVGALNDVAAAGDPTDADTLVQYVKQHINVLVGTDGIATFPAEAAPANAVSLAEVMRAIHVDVTGLNGAAMRGTDGANATVPDAAGTAAGLHATTDAKVDNVQADADNIQTRIPAALVGGRMDSDVGAIQNNAITAASINTDAIGADEIAASAVAEIQTGLATAAALITHDNKLAPVALDGGAATLGAMLAKMADDNGGADFDAGTDSLQEIRDRGDAAWAGGGAAPTVEQIRAEMDANSTQFVAILAAIAGLDDITVAQILAGIVDGTITVQETLTVLLARIGGNMTKAGNTYEYKDQANVTKLTRVIAANSVAATIA